MLVEVVVVVVVALVVALVVEAVVVGGPETVTVHCRVSPEKVS